VTGLDSIAWAARRVASRADTARTAALDVQVLASPEAADMAERAVLDADSVYRDARDLVDMIALIEKGAAAPVAESEYQRLTLEAAEARLAVRRAKRNVAVSGDEFDRALAAYDAAWMAVSRFEAAARAAHEGAES
jgi:hypothetical protein